MALLAFRADSAMGTLVFVICFCGAGIYLYRTIKYRDEFLAIFKD
jgi:cbb3-type cytochrome oxidase subunit 3